MRQKVKYETIVVGAIQTNCYLVYCEDTLECAIVDPGAEPEKIIRLVTEKGLKPGVLINTHGHVDHIGANKDIIEKYQIPLLIHPSDSPMLNCVQQSELSLFLGAKDSPPADRFMKDGEKIDVGNCSLKVIHTPGHSPGSVCLLGDDFLLSGDLLFYAGVGRTDLPGSSWEELESSLRNKILILPDEIIVLPGHGPHTSIKQEKHSNPFIR